MFKKVYESQLAFMENYNLWKRLAYLPRDFGVIVIEETTPSK
jgi:hypothetical protein